METVIIKPQIENNQYLFILPTELSEQVIEFVLKVR